MAMQNGMRTAYGQGMRRFCKKAGFILVLLLVIVFMACLSNCSYISYESDQEYKEHPAGKSIAFIMPGAGGYEGQYAKIEGYYSDAGITPVFIDIDWMEMNFDRLISFACRKIDNVNRFFPGRNNYFFGFSMGAVIALCVAEKYESKGTLLCSLSPAFIDDIARIPDWFKRIFSLPGYERIPEDTAVFLYGDRDNSVIRSGRLVMKRKRIYAGSRFVMVKGAKHNITGSAYLEQIKHEIGRMRNPD